MAGSKYSQRSRRKGFEEYPVNVVSTLTSQTPGGENFVWNENRTIFSRFETMTDCIGSRQESHPVLHQVSEFKMNRIENVEYDFGYPSGRYKINFQPFWVPRSTAQYITAADVVRLLNNEEYDRGSERWCTFAANAFASITQQAPDKLDVLQLGRDLYTLKGLFKQCAWLLKKVLDIFHRLGGYRGHFANTRTLRQLCRNIADGYLINEFGFKPLIREIESIIGGSVAIMRRLVFLRRTQGSVFTARYAEQVPFYGSDSDLGAADNWALRNARLWLRDVKGYCRYSCVAKIKNNLVGLNSFTSGISFWLAALGGRNIASFLWDLVPFSFVVDWNYNVSAFLDRYVSVEPFAGGLDVQSASTAFVKDCSGLLRVEDPQMVPASFDYGTLHYRVYDRQDGLDGSLNLFRSFYELTPKQYELLSALVIQRVRG